MFRCGAKFEAPSSSNEVRQAQTGSKEERWNRTVANHSGRPEAVVGVSLVNSLRAVVDHPSISVSLAFQLGC